MGHDMGTQIAPLDPAERDLAAAQLDAIVRVKHVRGRDDWKEAFLEWHCDAVARARAEAWVPGMLRTPDLIVEKMLTRFYRHQTVVMLKRLKADNLKLRRQLLDALGLHESCANGGGEPMHAILEGLQSSVI
jgi:hypothetical protein